MKALVVGGGSIGTRHLRNLAALGMQQCALVEPDEARGRAVGREMNAAYFPTIEDGFGWSPDFMLLATPTHLHVRDAIQAARRGIDLFVEKPLSHTAESLPELSDVVESKRLVTLVGCNMRFHPGPAKIKELVDGGKLGRILFARVHVGSYLPDWRPGADYRSNYAARRETGGGCILDCIHEIDLARWYLGEVQSVFCVAATTRTLEIETEDVASLTCRHADGAMSEIHLDYVQRTYERGCQIVGEYGSVFWDFNLGQVRWFDAHSSEWTTYSQPPGWQVNDMYVEEMKHFVQCVRERRQTVLPVSDAVSLMQVVFAAKASAREGRMVTTHKEVLA